MERRVLLAISLSFLVLFVYQALFVPPHAGAERRQRDRPVATAAPPLAGTLTPGNVSRGRAHRGAADARLSSATPKSAKSSSRRRRCARCSPTAARGSGTGC